MSFQKIVYKRIPALQVNDSKGFDFTEIFKGNMEEETIQELDDYLNKGYQTMPFNNEAYRYMFDFLLNQEGNLYLHCSAGKDRTGVAIALIMLALGFTEKDIFTEYLKSNQLIDEILPKLKIKFPLVKEKFLRKIYCVDSSSLEVSMSEIKKKYSSMKAFLNQNIN